MFGSGPAKFAPHAIVCSRGITTCASTAVGATIRTVKSKATIGANAASDALFQYFNYSSSLFYGKISVYSYLRVANKLPVLRRLSRGWNNRCGEDFRGNRRPSIAKGRSKFSKCLNLFQIDMSTKTSEGGNQLGKVPVAGMWGRADFSVLIPCFSEDSFCGDPPEWTSVQR
jgi:hypothetical protein